MEPDESVGGEGWYTTCGACNGHGCDWCIPMDEAEDERGESE